MDRLAHLQATSGVSKYSEIKVGPRMLDKLHCSSTDESSSVGKVIWIGKLELVATGEILAEVSESDEIVGSTDSCEG